MRRILLDTSAYSAFKRGHDDIRTILQEADDITVTPVVLGELYAGFARGRHRRKNEQELRLFLSSPRVRLVNIDDETAALCPCPQRSPLGGNADPNQRRLDRRQCDAVRRGGRDD